MWTTLVAVIQQKNRGKELEYFLAEIRSAGICVLEIEPEWMYRLFGENNSRQPFVKQESLLLTDVPKVAIEAGHAGIALLGLEWKGGLHIPHAAYVVQSLEDVDADYLRMVWQRFHHQPLVIVQTQRLCIRELVCGEAEIFCELAMEAGLRLKDMPKHPSEEERNEFLQAYIRYQYGFFGYGIWALVEKKSGELVGIAGIEDRDNGGETYLELGYAVLPKKRRQGYAREACEAILAYVRERMERKGKIKCFVPKENVASRRTAQSIGMLQTEDIFDVFCCYEWIL